MYHLAEVSYAVIYLLVGKRNFSDIEKEEDRIVSPELCSGDTIAGRKHKKTITRAKNISAMESQQKKSGNYLRFFAMITTSMVAMFLLMYTHSYQIVDHFWFSETRLFMALIMGGAMIIIMLLYMLHMYQNRRKNIAILALGAVLIASGIWLVRSQTTVSGVDYMEGMIPHHSIAILTSERSQIKDVRVRELADKIIEAQRREIMEMQWLIYDIKENGVVETEEEKEKRSIPLFEGSTEQETINMARSGE